MPVTAPASTVLDRLEAALGRAGMIVDASEARSYTTDWRGVLQGSALAVLRPRSTAETAAAMRLCHEHGIAVVPQGGNTCLTGGATPDASGRQVVLSTARLDRIRRLDPLDLTMTVEAGVVLATAQEAADAEGALLPLSLGAQGSARIGGLLSTNAGGTQTIRYGNARDLCLGLEVVLADGTVLDLLRRLRKDNTGYALRHLFVGAEGTLGVITAAVLKLAARPRERCTALCGIPSPEAALALLGRIQAEDQPSLTCFELMPRLSVAMALRHIEGVADPLASPHAWYALVELSSPRRDAGLRDRLEASLGEALEAGLVEDAVLAESEAQRIALWRAREEQSEAQKREGPHLRFDVAVPVSSVPALVRMGTEAVERVLPDIRPNPFGHVGDGNVHFNLMAPAGMDAAGFAPYAAPLSAALLDEVRRLEGSFSAEHGIGSIKTDLLAQWRGGPELAAMQRIKAALDPTGVMNPGKLFAG